MCLYTAQYSRSSIFLLFRNEISDDQSNELTRSTNSKINNINKQKLSIKTLSILVAVRITHPNWLAYLFSESICFKVSCGARALHSTLSICGGPDFFLYYRIRLVKVKLT